MFLPCPSCIIFSIRGLVILSFHYVFSNTLFCISLFSLFSFFPYPVLNTWSWIFLFIRVFCFLAFLTHGLVFFLSSCSSGVFFQHVVLYIFPFLLFFCNFFFIHAVLYLSLPSILQYFPLLSIFSSTRSLVYFFLCFNLSYCFLVFFSLFL